MSTSRDRGIIRCAALCRRRLGTPLAFLRRDPRCRSAGRHWALPRGSIRFRAGPLLDTGGADLPVYYGVAQACDRQAWSSQIYPIAQEGWSAIEKSRRGHPIFAARQSGIGRLLHRHMSATWWAVTGSNRRPPRCKRDALPTELTARIQALAPLCVRWQDHALD
jgi:hypothetical protein